MPACSIVISTVSNIAVMISLSFWLRTGPFSHSNPAEAFWKDAFVQRDVAENIRFSGQLYFPANDK